MYLIFMSVEIEAKKLDWHLRHYEHEGWYIATGIGHLAESDQKCFYVYVKAEDTNVKEVVPSEWASYPVIVKEMGDVNVRL